MGYGNEASGGDVSVGSGGCGTREQRYEGTHWCFVRGELFVV